MIRGVFESVVGKLDNVTCTIFFTYVDVYLGRPPKKPPILSDPLDEILSVDFLENGSASLNNSHTIRLGYSCFD